VSLATPVAATSTIATTADPATAVTMHALVYGGPGLKSWSVVAKPQLRDDTDAIIRVDVTTICGSDLHILKGDVPEVSVGRILGHEAIGTVESVGARVTALHPGDRVLVSAITSCATCVYCRQSRYGQCLNGGGWVLGHLIDGTQADYVRVPYCETSTYLIPDDADGEELLMLSDILPTGYEVGVLNGRVQPGDDVVVVGAGPVGLSAMTTARLLSPRQIIAIDLDDGRLAQARRFGADVTINNATESPLEQVRALTGGLGAQVVMEAVGLAATFELATTLVRPGGRVANIGVHGQPVTLHMEQLWGRDLTLTMGLVDTHSIPTLLSLMSAQRLDARHFVTHRFTSDRFVDAYDTFAHAATTGALKVVVTPN